MSGATSIWGGTSGDESAIGVSANSTRSLLAGES